jgi:hypothetical protein
MLLKRKSNCKGVFFVFAIYCAGFVYAKDYVPPTSPDLYRDKADLNPVSTFLKTGAYVGALGSVGQSMKSSSCGSDGIVVYDYGLSFGYRKFRKNWSLWEVGMDIGRGLAGCSASNINSDLEVALRLGYGFYLTEGVYGIFNVGPLLSYARAQYESTEAHKEPKSKDASLGFGVFGGYDLNFVITQEVHFLVGGVFRYQNHSFKKAIAKGTNTEFDFPKDISTYSIGARLGLRYMI